MTDGGDGIGLSDWIAALRGELETAAKAGRSSSLRLRVAELELDLEVVSTREKEGRAGIRFWVVDVGGSGMRSNSTTQRLKLTLNPVDPGGSVLDVGDQLTGPSD